MFMLSNMSKIFVLCLMVFFGFSINSSEAIVAVDHKKIEGKDNIEVYVPKVKDSKHKANQEKINSILSGFAQGGLADFKEVLAEDKKQGADEDRIQYYTFYSGYRVAYNDNDILSVALDGYMYTGGAHGMSWRNSVTTDLATGKIYKLNDLFAKDSNYQDVLNEKIEKQIDEIEGLRDAIEFYGVNENTSFYITKELLVIYYQEYEIGPYVIGKPSFYIFLNDIRDILATELKYTI